MKRLFAVALIASLGQSSLVFAAGPIAASAAKASNETAAASQPATSPAPAGFVSFAKAAGVRSAPAPGVLAQQTGTVSQSGMGKGTKITILVGAVAAFVGSAYAIDHGVKDVTPSSLGQRHDNDVFKQQ